MNLSSGMNSWHGLHPLHHHLRRGWEGPRDGRGSWEPSITSQYLLFIKRDFARDSVVPWPSDLWCPWGETNHSLQTQKSDEDSQCLPNELSVKAWLNFCWWVSSIREVGKGCPFNGPMLDKRECWFEKHFSVNANYEFLSRAISSFHVCQWLLRCDWKF